jgi:hypothetical protein
MLTLVLFGYAKRQALPPALTFSDRDVVVGIHDSGISRNTPPHDENPFFIRYSRAASHGNAGRCFWEQPAR